MMQEGENMPAYQKAIWAAAGVTVLAILVLGYFLFLAPAAKEKPAGETALTPRDVPLAAPPQPAVAAEEKDLSALDLDIDRSDAAVRELVGASRVPGALREWIGRKDLLRTVVAAVDNVAQGHSPAAQLAFLAPRQKFSVLQENGASRIHPGSFRRYDGLVDTFVAIPDETLVFWYRKLSPTLESAFRELGYPGVTFRERLQQAGDVLARAPVDAANAVLEQKVVTYAFIDGRLENLPPAHKHMLRLGPRNALLIQKKMRAFLAAL
jgi:hypothetical protein